MSKEMKPRIVRRPRGKHDLYHCVPAVSAGILTQPYGKRRL